MRQRERTSYYPAFYRVLFQTVAGPMARDFRNTGRTATVTIEQRVREVVRRHLIHRSPADRLCEDELVARLTDVLSFEHNAPSAPVSSVSGTKTRSSVPNPAERQQ